MFVPLVFFTRKNSTMTCQVSMCTLRVQVLFFTTFLVLDVNDNFYLVMTIFTEFAIAQWQWWSEVVDYFSHCFFTWTVVVDIIASQVSHQFDLFVRNFNRFFEHHPYNTLEIFKRFFIVNNEAKCMPIFANVLKEDS